MSKEAQDLFDAFKRTMPTHWSGTSIVVADSVVIAAPYGVSDCKTLNLAGKDEVAGTALTRVRKVVSVYHYIFTAIDLFMHYTNGNSWRWNERRLSSAGPAQQWQSQ